MKSWKKCFVESGYSIQHYNDVGILRTDRAVAGSVRSLSAPVGRDLAALIV